MSRLLPASSSFSWGFLAFIYFLNTGLFLVVYKHCPGYICFPARIPKAWYHSRSFGKPLAYSSDFKEQFLNIAFLEKQVPEWVIAPWWDTTNNDLACQELWRLLGIKRLWAGSSSNTEPWDGRAAQVHHAYMHGFHGCLGDMLSFVLSSWLLSRRSLTFYFWDFHYLGILRALSPKLHDLKKLISWPSNLVWIMSLSRGYL